MGSNHGCFRALILAFIHQNSTTAPLSTSKMPFKMICTFVNWQDLELSILIPIQVINPDRSIAQKIHKIAYLGTLTGAENIPYQYLMKSQNKKQNQITNIVVIREMPRLHHKSGEIIIRARHDTDLSDKVLNRINASKQPLIILRGLGYTQSGNRKPVKITWQYKTPTIKQDSDRRSATITGEINKVINVAIGKRCL